MTTPTVSGNKGPKLNYTHDAMIDLILQEPTVTAEELAQVFGYSAGWVSRILASDSFSARLAQRRHELIDPLIAQSVNERVAGITIRSLDIINNTLEKEQGAAYALDALTIASKVASSM